MIFDRSQTVIWPIDGTLTATTTPGQNEAGSNGNKGVTTP